MKAAAPLRPNTRLTPVRIEAPAPTDRLFFAVFTDCSIRYFSAIPAFDGVTKCALPRVPRQSIWILAYRISSTCVCSARRGEAHNRKSEKRQKEHAMNTNPVTKHQHKASAAALKQTTQAGRMRAAIEQAVSIGPSFLRGDINADQMANTMVKAVRGYAEQEQAAGGNGVPQSAEAQEIQNVLAELMGCGSGYLAGRCDAACVARTMTQMVHEFGKR